MASLRRVINGLAPSMEVGKICRNEGHDYASLFSPSSTSLQFAIYIVSI